MHDGKRQHTCRSSLEWINKVHTPKVVGVPRGSKAIRPTHQELRTELAARRWHGVNAKRQRTQKLLVRVVATVVPIPGQTATGRGTTRLPIAICCRFRALPRFAEVRVIACLPPRTMHAQVKLNARWTVDTRMMKAMLTTISINDITQIYQANCLCISGCLSPTSR